MLHFEFEFFIFEFQILNLCFKFGTSSFEFKNSLSLKVPWFYRGFRWFQTFQHFRSAAHFEKHICTSFNSFKRYYKQSIFYKDIMCSFEFRETNNRKIEWKHWSMLFWNSFCYLLWTNGFYNLFYIFMHETYFVKYNT